MNPRWTGLAKVQLGISTARSGISFLSAVADRFGLWGVYGQPNVSWGNYARFVDYTAELNWFLPAFLECFTVRRRGVDRFGSGIDCLVSDLRIFCPVRDQPPSVGHPNFVAWL
jgi:hypothetical protein